MNLAVLVPAYNESTQIRQLVEKIRSLGLFTIVVDDGSTDTTFEEAKAGGAFVIRHERNYGKGAALRTGFQYILGKDFDTVVVMDGDGQHSPADIQKFIDIAAKHPRAVVVGSRMADTKNMPIDRKLTNMFMSIIVSFVCRQNIPDSQCGFRLLRKDLLEKIKIDSSRFEVESEILIKATAAGAKIMSVPIQTLYGSEESQINPFWDTFRFMVFLLRLPFIR